MKQKKMDPSLQKMVKKAKKTTKTNTGIFSGRSGWFSPNVSKDFKDKWTQNGGHEASSGLMNDASLKSGGISSESWPDLYFSLNYDSELISRVTRNSKYPVVLFHPLFITECLKVNSFGQVSVGSFQILPPELIAIMRKKFPDWKPAYL